MKLKKYNTFFHTKHKKKHKLENIKCINCGEKGHVYVNCPYPIIKYGDLSSNKSICRRLRNITNIINSKFRRHQSSSQKHLLQSIKERLITFFINKCTKESHRGLVPRPPQPVVRQQESISKSNNIRIIRSDIMTTNKVDNIYLKNREHLQYIQLIEDPKLLKYGY